jgi:hypothetical protein
MLSPTNYVKKLYVSIPKVKQINFLRNDNHQYLIGCMRHISGWSLVLEKIPNANFGV